MKKYLVFAITLAALVANSEIRADENAWPSVTVSSLVSSKYLGFGTGNVLSKDPAVQSDLFVLFKSGIYLDLWNSRSLRGSWDDGSLGNEVDYQVGWKGSLATNLTLNIGVQYFDEPKAFTLGAGDILYPHVFLTRDFKVLSLTAGFENYTTMPESGFQGGNLISLGAGRSQSLFGEKVGVQASAALVYDTGTLGSGEGFIMRGNLGANWNITKRLTWNVIGINWYVPLTPHDSRVTDAVFTSGLTFRFN